MSETKTAETDRSEWLPQTGEKDMATPVEPEIAEPGDPFDSVIQAAEKLEARAKAQDAILNIIVKRTFGGDWVCHSKSGTPESEQTANLGAAGAERVATFLGIQESNWRNLGKEWSEDHKHYSYAYCADFTFCGVTRRAEGRAGTRDKFFSGGKELEDVNEDDIRVAAFRECVKKGVTRLCGLRNIPLSKLKELGYDLGLVKKVDFKGTQLKKEDLKPGAGGLIAKTIQVVKLEKFEGVNKATNKPWTRFDLHDAEGVKYSIFADGTSKRVLKLQEAEEDQRAIGIWIKVVEYNGRQQYQVEKVEGDES